MSEAVVRAERELYAYVLALQSVLLASTEDAMPQSLWGGADSGGGGVPDTLLQQVECETAQERQRIHRLVRQQLAPQLASLRVAIVQLGGGQDAAGGVVDVPVATLDQEIAAAAAESAALGRRMVELYDEAALLAARIEAEMMDTAVPSL
ncbi:hypothetical protein NESM_000093200 [Novymonas esmeraldas]|uniref:Uncharacterized protein n=1 Tax=Novymonas esmeraldas TaxID=1808958 RepID=A0AAW0F412_9TRYP